jgi:hypothetical protein
MSRNTRNSAMADAMLAAAANKVAHDDGFVEPTVSDAVIATADMIRDANGGRIVEMRIKVDPSLLTLTQTGTAATQWAQVEIGGTRGWKVAMTLKVPMSQLSPATRENAARRRRAKDLKLQGAVASKSSDNSLI